uniref:Uncharacterized protein n=1 Tax=Pseudictyota dubia TaxID=2749911 RepID=A0A7R9VXX9_9STRA
MTVKNSSKGGTASGLDPSIPVVTATIVDPNEMGEGGEGGFNNESMPPSSYGGGSAASAVMNNSSTMPPAFVPGSSVQNSGSVAINAASVKQPKTTTTTTTTYTYSTAAPAAAAAPRPMNLGR